MNKSFVKVVTFVVAISSGIGFYSSSVLSDDLKGLVIVKNSQKDLILKSR